MYATTCLILRKGDPEKIPPHLLLPRDVSINDALNSDVLSIFLEACFGDLLEEDKPRMRAYACLARIKTLTRVCHQWRDIIYHPTVLYKLLQMGGIDFACKQDEYLPVNANWLNKRHHLCYRFNLCYKDGSTELTLNNVPVIGLGAQPLTCPNARPGYQCPEHPPPYVYFARRQLPRRASSRLYTPEAFMFTGKRALWGYYRRPKTLKDDSGVLTQYQEENGHYGRATTAARWALRRYKGYTRPFLTMLEMIRRYTLKKQEDVGILDKTRFEALQKLIRQFRDDE